METRLIINSIASAVRVKLSGEGTGHDWWHIERVWKMAKRIGRAEGADLFVVELAALLHDIADWKFHGGDDSVGPRVARKMLMKQRVPQDVTTHVCDIIARMSFKGAKIKDTMPTLEGKIVQDADRLDALGAIGIARAFAYGGSRNRPLHIPGKKPVQHTFKKAYFHANSTTVNHFYEKLLLLKDRMKTKTGRRIAAGRHRFLEGFLAQFFAEWEGRR